MSASTDFSHVWRSFLAAGFTVPTLQRDYPQWHRGRPRYWCWVLEVDSPAVIARWQQARQRLSSWLLDDQRLPHITVAVCGFYQPQQASPDDPELPPGTEPSQAPGFSGNDDFTRRQLDRQLLALDRLNSSAFELQIGGANSFTSAAFLEVRDPSGALNRLRDCLSPKANDFRQGPYCPHITLGLYRARMDCQRLAPILCQSSDITPLPLPIKSLALVSYASDNVGSPLRLERRVRLAGVTHSL